MKNLSQREIYEAMDRALERVAAKYEAGTLDMSGRYYSDEELAGMKALNKISLPLKPVRVNAGSAA